MKHCDLKSVRRYADILARRDMPGTAEILTDMAAEIEAWRSTFGEYHAAISSLHLRRHAPVIYAALTDMLPPTKEPTDAQ